MLFYSHLVVGKFYTIVIKITEVDSECSFTYKEYFTPTKSSGNICISLEFEEYNEAKEYTLKYYFI